MRRGTSPTHIFTTDIDLSEVIKDIYITYQQNKRTIVEKTNPSITIENKKISTELTQEETLRFSDQGNVKIQIRIKTKNDKPIASQVFVTTVNEILKDGMI